MLSRFECGCHCEWPSAWCQLCVRVCVCVDMYIYIYICVCMCIEYVSVCFCERVSGITVRIRYWNPWAKTPSRIPNLASRKGLPFLNLF